MKSINDRLRHAWKRLRGINTKIAKRRAKGQKTPELASLRRHIKKKIDWLEKHKPVAPETKLIAYFDGKPVSAWIVPWLQKSRDHGWNGVLVSGYRTPEYSQSLCYAICGAPRCPGRCAGLTSNHTHLGPGAGAVDVTDYSNFGDIQRQIGSPLRNNLPSDPVHYSGSGY